MDNSNSIFTIFRNRHEANSAVKSLRQAGIENSDIWVFQAKPGGLHDFSRVPRYQIKNGAVLGSILGALVFCSSFFWASESINLNPVVFFFTGFVLSALIGAIIGTLVGIGTPDTAAKRYGQYLQSGGVLMSVHSRTSAQDERVYSVLNTLGGLDVQSMNELKTWAIAHIEILDLEMDEVVPPEKSKKLSLVRENYEPSVWI